MAMLQSIVMRKPPPAPTSTGKKVPAEAEPPQGHAMERARQFALQRGMPAPRADAAPKPAATRKPPARKKKP